MFESVKKYLKPEPKASDYMLTDLDDMPEQDSGDWRYFNDEYYRSEHWQATIKIFRRAAKCCLICKITDEEHKQKTGSHLDTHHRNYNHKGWERWCDLELICRVCHKREQTGEIIIADIPPSFPSIDPIHPDEPDPMFPASFGWVSRQEQQVRSAREHAAAAKKAESRPLQLAEQIKEDYQLVAPPAPPVNAEAERIAQEQAKLAEMVAAHTEKAQLQHHKETLEAALEHYGKEFWRAYNHGLKDLRKGIIGPLAMRDLMERYQGQIAHLFWLLEKKDKEIIEVCPEYQPVRKQKLRNKVNDVLPKANGRDAEGPQ